MTSAPKPEKSARWCLPKFAVELIDAKPNNLWSEAARASVRFMRFYEVGEPVRVACAHCGKKKTVLWTQLCSFRIAEPLTFRLKKSDTVYPPLTPVCQTHIMAPELIDIPAPEPPGETGTP
jgi:hypothetical protein